MTINIQFVNMPTSETMEAYTIKKLQRLYDVYDSIIALIVYFKIENDSKGKGKICEVEIRVSWASFFASSNEKNFELAVKHTVSDLENN
jgi:putative sigma-54 modulation protein